MAAYTLITIFSGLITLSYLAFLVWCSVGWFKYKSGTDKKLLRSEPTVYYPSLSVVIPYRNEEKHLKSLFNSLKSQNYPRDKFEVIAVNDHSSDNSHSIISQFESEFMKSMDLPDGKSGKKNALEAGLQKASGEYIITVDADCQMSENWLLSFAIGIADENPDLIIGPVGMKGGKTFPALMQEIEFLALQGVTFGAASNGRPILCNGANLGIKKEVFEKVGGYAGVDHFPSGDDIMILQKIKSLLSEPKIIPLKNEAGIVYTTPKEKLSEILMQRQRWASKMKYYRDLLLTLTGSVVFFMNFSIIFTFVLSFFNSIFIPLCLVLFGIKVLTDNIFFLFVAPFFHRQNIWGYSIPVSFLYPIFVVVTGILAPLLPVKWKDRKY